MENQADEKQQQEETMLMNTSLWKYTCNVMSISLVTGVSNIATTKNRIRNYLKIAVLLLCAAGFFYQASEFLQFYLSYPTVVDIRVGVPDHYIAPAYTYCNYNGVMRKKFCEKYQERCYVPSDIEDFCFTHHEFCKYAWVNNDTVLKIPKEEFKDFEKEISFEELKELSHDFKPLQQFAEYDIEEIKGPYLMRKFNDEAVLCYTEYLRVDSSQPPQVIEKRRRKRQHEEILMPPPYSHKCINYTDLWEKNNKTGPRSQKACKAYCESEYSRSQWNCSSSYTMYPTDGPYCDDYVYDYVEDINESEEVRACAAKCKVDCKITKLLYELQERYVEEDIANLPGDELTYVNVYIMRPEVVTYQHRAQYQELEVFSYIGGFMGAWIGVSLVAVIDLLESIVRITSFYFRRKALINRRKAQSVHTSPIRSSP